MGINYRVVGMVGQRWKIGGVFISVGVYGKDSPHFDVLEKAFRKGVKNVGRIEEKKTSTPVKPAGKDKPNA